MGFIKYFARVSVIRGVSKLSKMDQNVHHMTGNCLLDPFRLKCFYVSCEKVRPLQIFCLSIKISSRQYPTLAVGGVKLC